MKPVHYININDVQAVIEHAKRNYINMPDRVHLPNMTRILTDAERMALAYFSASLYVAGSHGTDTSGYVAMYLPFDSGTATDE